MFLTLFPDIGASVMFENARYISREKYMDGRKTQTLVRLLFEKVVSGFQVADSEPTGTPNFG